MKTEFKIEGAKEMERLLHNLGPQVANKLGMSSLRAAAKPIVQEARRLVPKDTGDLGRSITTKADRQRSGNDTRELKIGFKPPVSARAHFVEFGTSKMAAKPFMRPALDSKAKEALDAMGKVLGVGIEREALKMAKK